MLNLPASKSMRKPSKAYRNKRRLQVSSKERVAFSSCTQNALGPGPEMEPCSPASPKLRRLALNVAISGALLWPRRQVAKMLTGVSILHLATCFFASNQD